MTAAGGRGWLLMRRGGALWGVENAAVESLTRGHGDFRIGLANAEATELCIDEIVGVVAELTVRPVAAALRRFWPHRADGLAVHAAVPLVVVDPQRPPCALWVPQPDAPDDGEGEGRDV